MNSCILRDDDKFFTIEIDGRKYTPKPCSGVVQSAIAFSTNYGHPLNNTPLGICKSDYKTISSIPTHYDRPCLCLISIGVATILKPGSKWFQPARFRFIYQAGPTLLHNRGDKSHLVEREGWDEAGPDSHLAIGVSKIGHMIVTYSKCATLAMVAKELQSHNCISGMRLGGSNPYFTYKDRVLIKGSGIGIQFSEK